MINTTLCYIENNGKYLMMLRNKKKNDLNEGKWIGIGGKFEENESPDACLLREVKEETGLCLSSYSFVGIIHFRSEKDDEEMYLYTGYINDAPSEIECNEGTLRWTDKNEIMSLNLWEGDRIFLERMIRGEKGLDLTLCYEGDRLVKVVEN